MLRRTTRTTVGIAIVLLAACANPRPETTTPANTVVTSSTNAAPVVVPADAPAAPLVVSRNAAATRPPALGIVADPPADLSAYVKLPDGTFAPALNGVRNAPAMAWPEDVPFAPIVGKEKTHGGVEWYVHADGSKSTTTKIFRKDLGRDDPITQVATPRKQSRKQ